MKSDRDFLEALDCRTEFIDSKIAAELRRINSEIVKSRHSESKTTAQLYTQLVDLANKSGDHSGILQYFALKSYHSLLQNTSEKNEPIPTLREQLFSSWALKELGKQTFVKQKNIDAGGDWAKLEAVLAKLEQQSIYVCRSVDPCQSWGGSDPSLILTKAPNPNAAMVYFENDGSLGIQPSDIADSEDLWLTCVEAGTACRNCGNRHDSGKEVHRPVKQLLLRLLKESGFRAVGDWTDAVRVTGDWISTKAGTDTTTD